MTMRALTPGGIQITNFGPSEVTQTFDGLHLQWRGATRTEDGWKNVGVSIDMSAADAMDLVVALTSAVQKHAEYEARLLPNFAKRLAKKLEKRE